MKQSDSLKQHDQNIRNPSEQKGSYGAGTSGDASDAHGIAVSDEELTAATGGTNPYGRQDALAVKWDSNGRPIQWRTLLRERYHFECPDCGRWLYEGLGGVLFCETCNHGYTSRLKIYDD